MPDLPGRIVDFHVHLFPDKLFESIWDFFLKKYGWDVIYRLYYRECIDYLRASGVETIVYSNYAHRQGIAAGLNEWNLKVLDEIPGIYCFAAYHPDDSDGLDMARRILDHPRVLGFKLQLLVQRFYPHDKRMFPLYEMVIDRGKRILFHVGTGPEPNEFVGLREFKRLLEVFPGLHANVAHMGAFEYQGFMDLLETYPGLCFDTAFAFSPELNAASCLSPEVFDRHRDRIVYGSDFPFLTFSREREIEALLRLGLSQQFYDAVFRENGRQLITASAAEA